MFVNNGDEIEMGYEMGFSRGKGKVYVINGSYMQKYFINPWFD